MLHLKDNQLDTRNLVDNFKGLEEREIIELLDKTRSPLQIAIENLNHDFNIGSIIRTANAFNVSAVHIIGSRRYNSRGAMKTDAYMHIYHHFTIDEFVAWLQCDKQLRLNLRNASINADPRNAVRLSGKSEKEMAPLSLAKNAKLVGVDLLDNISQPIENVKLPLNTVLLFGCEEAGLSNDAQQIALKSSGKILHITQSGSTRSMNVGHAAAIAMFKWRMDNLIF